MLSSRRQKRRPFRLSLAAAQFAVHNSRMSGRELKKEWNRRTLDAAALSRSVMPASARRTILSGACLLLAVAAMAQAPLPPQRPAHLDRRESPAETTPAPTVAPSPAAPSGLPQSTGKRGPSVESDKRPSTPAVPLVEAPYHPMTEPGQMTPQRRAAIRSCAEEWQKLKRSGAAGIRTWHDFSMECLQRKR